MHRIPHGVASCSGLNPNKPVVLLQHGLLASSADYIFVGPQKSLGYLLADLGYDVWMANARGNRYSKNHIILSPSEGKFWDFSWHEIGVYDIPAQIDYILNCTNQEKIFYIGHSQGTTAFYVMCSEKPEYNDKIRAMFSLAPVAYMGHIVSPLPRFLAQFEGGLKLLLTMIGAHEFMPNQGIIFRFGSVLCAEDSPVKSICTNTLFILCGYNPEQMDVDILPVLFGHSPAGASTKQFLHYVQNVKAEKRSLKKGSPVAYMGHIVSPLPRFLAQFEGGLKLLLTMIGAHEFMPNQGIIFRFGSVLCAEDSPVKSICTNTLFILCGYNPEQMDVDILPVLFGHSPAGASTKQFLHYVQNVKAVDKFRQYDYGFFRNMIKYKKRSPPSYDTSKITAPIALMYSLNDLLSSDIDVMKLYNELPNVFKLYLVPDKKFNHLDFLYAKDVVSLLYNELFSLMSRCITFLDYLREYFVGRYKNINTENRNRKLFINE